MSIQRTPLPPPLLGGTYACCIAHGCTGGRCKRSRRVWDDDNFHHAGGIGGQGRVGGEQRGGEFRRGGDARRDCKRERRRERGRERPGGRVSRFGNLGHLKIQFKRLSGDGFAGVFNGSQRRGFTDRPGREYDDGAGQSNQQQDGGNQPNVALRRFLRFWGAHSNACWLGAPVDGISAPAPYVRPFHGLVRPLRLWINGTARWAYVRLAHGWKQPPGSATHPRGWG